MHEGERDKHREKECEEQAALLRHYALSPREHTHTHTCIVSFLFLFFFFSIYRQFISFLFVTGYIFLSVCFTSIDQLYTRFVSTGSPFVFGKEQSIFGVRVEEGALVLFWQTLHAGDRMRFTRLETFFFSFSSFNWTQLLRRRIRIFNLVTSGY